MTLFGWLAAACGFLWALIMLVVVVVDVTLALTGSTTITDWCHADYEIHLWRHRVFWTIAWSALFFAGLYLMCHLYGVHPRG